MTIIQFKILGICFIFTQNELSRRKKYAQIKIACFRRDKMSRLVKEKVSQERWKGCDSLQMVALVEGTIKLNQGFYFNFVSLTTKYLTLLNKGD